MSNSIAWTEEKRGSVHFKKLLGEGDLDHVVVPLNTLAHKKEHTAVDNKVLFTLAQRACAEWRLHQDLEGVVLSNCKRLLSVQLVSLPHLHF